MFACCQTRRTRKMALSLSRSWSSNNSRYIRRRICATGWSCRAESRVCVRLRVLVQCVTRLPSSAPSFLLGCSCKTLPAPLDMSSACASTRRSCSFPFFCLVARTRRTVLLPGHAAVFAQRCEDGAQILEDAKVAGGHDSHYACAASLADRGCIFVFSGHAYHSDNVHLNDVGVEAFCRAIKDHVEARFLFLSAVSTEPSFCLLSLLFFLCGVIRGPTS